MASPPSPPSTASLRWQILRRAFLSRPSHTDGLSKIGINSISRKALHGFNLIPHYLLTEPPTEESKSNDVDALKDAYVRYKLPKGETCELVLIQREENHVDIKDFEISNRFDIDNTGLVCQWPSEDVLAHFCMTHADMFRSKRILELGSGYGLAGLAIAAGTDALEVVLSDGNPQVVDYIQRNICANAGVIGDTKVKAATLHWNLDHISNFSYKFDIIIASDCTFFKEFHGGLALTVKSLLKPSDTSVALFFSPKRGDSLDKFLEKIRETGLRFTVIEKYDSKVWALHTKFLHGDNSSWPNYDMDHCYPLLVMGANSSITVILAIISISVGLYLTFSQIVLILVIVLAEIVSPRRVRN